MKSVLDHAPRPACPGCARPMMPVRIKGTRTAPLRSFACRDCGTAFSEAAWLQALAPDRALTLNFEARSRPH